MEKNYRREFWQLYKPCVTVLWTDLETMHPDVETKKSVSQDRWYPQLKFPLKEKVLLLSNPTIDDIFVYEKSTKINCQWSKTFLPGTLVKKIGAISYWLKDEFRNPSNISKVLSCNTRYVQNNFEIIFKSSFSIEYNH